MNALPFTQTCENTPISKKKAEKPSIQAKLVALHKANVDLCVLRLVTVVVKMKIQF